jgi:hypothetical protein
MEKSEGITNLKIWLEPGTSQFAYSSFLPYSIRQICMIRGAFFFGATGEGLPLIGDSQVGEIY